MIQTRCERAQRFRVRAMNRAMKRTNQNERKVMNDKVDELTKGMARSVTRRQALRRFGAGLAAVLMAGLGLAYKAEAGGNGRSTASRVSDVAAMATASGCTTAVTSAFPVTAWKGLSWTAPRAGQLVVKWVAKQYRAA